MINIEKLEASYFYQRLPPALAVCAAGSDFNDFLFINIKKYNF